MKNPTPDLLQQAARGMDIDALTEAVFSSCMSLVFTNQLGDEAFQERFRASVVQNAYGLRHVIEGELSIEDLELDHVLSFATAQAQLRIPQRLTQRSYRVSFYVQWERWIDKVRELVYAHDLDARETFVIVHRLTQLLMGYQDHVATLVADTYTRDYDALSRSRAHIRRNVVRDVLDGREDRLTSTDLGILAYSLQHHHVAVFLPEVTEAVADRMAEGLRLAARGNQVLVHRLNLDSSAIWISRVEPWNKSNVDELVRSLEDAGVTATVSSSGSGSDGFRDTLTQAFDAERVRQAWLRTGESSQSRVLRYSNAGLEVLLLQNPRLARDFVRAELGELADNTPQAARLRETLEVSFRFGSHVAAAEHLQLHEHTVRNRLTRAAEVIGHDLQRRRTELQVAVRLSRLLDGADTDESSDALEDLRDLGD